jgi:hypothetical protein
MGVALNAYQRRACASRTPVRGGIGGLACHGVWVLPRLPRRRTGRIWGGALVRPGSGGYFRAKNERLGVPSLVVFGLRELG